MVKNIPKGIKKINFLIFFNGTVYLLKPSETEGSPSLNLLISLNTKRKEARVNEKLQKEINTTIIKTSSFIINNILS